MAIKGLTDRDSITPRFPRIGKLRKGGEKTATGFGPDLNHWRFTSDRAEAEAAFVAAYGDSPAQINVYLPHASVEDNFQTWKEEWKSGGLGHRCDGETCTIWLGADGKYHREPKPCPGGCKEVGRLEVVIPEMLQAGHVGTVTMETHSLNDLISISETLLKTAELRGDNPLGLRGILFSLRRVPEEISVPGFGKNAGKRQRVEKWLVKIEPAVDWVQTQMALSRTDTPALTADGAEQLDGEVVHEIPREEQPSGDKIALRNAPDELRAKVLSNIAIARRNGFIYSDPEHPADNYRKAIVSNLEECFERDSDKRRAVVWYLTGKESSKDLDDAEINVLHKWLNAKPDGDGVWHVDEDACREAHACLTEARKELGQSALPGIDADDQTRPF